jgi:NAD-dependent SIR2 family protein deacetylase
MIPDPLRQHLRSCQNIDNLHQAAGSREVLELHGNLFCGPVPRCPAAERFCVPTSSACPGARNGAAPRWSRSTRNRPLSLDADVFLRGKAAEILPRLLEQVWR